MRPKPSGLGSTYAAQFDDPAVVATYDKRPPYADDAVSFVVDLAGGQDGDILDLGCGTGELARRLAAGVRSVTAIDRSPRMIARARQAPGGSAPNVEWIVGRVEDLPTSRTFTLALSAASFHWFDWDAVCPMLAGRLQSRPLVLVDRQERESGWSSQLRALNARYSTNREFQPYDLVEELTARSCYAVDGRRTFDQGLLLQTIDDYIASMHSRNGFSLNRMSAEAAREFDDAVRSAVEPSSTRGVLKLPLETTVVWGRVLSANLT